MQTLKYNFFYANSLVDQLVGKQADSETGGMDTVGYYTASPVHNMGSILFFMTLLPVIHLILTLAKRTSKMFKI